MHEADSGHGRLRYYTLRSTDPVRARAFYSELFTWRLSPRGDARDDVFSIEKAGAPGTLGWIRPSSPQAAYADRWIPHVQVRDAAATAALARKLGGRELPLEADSAHDLHLVDPTEALLAVRTDDPPPSPLTQRPAPLGSFCWAQLLTHDIERARVFYNEVIGWGVSDFPSADGLPALVFSADDTPIGGALQMPVSATAPSSWLPYVAVARVRESLARAVTLGATTQRDTTEMPGMGRFAVLADPLGAQLALWEEAG